MDEFLRRRAMSCIAARNRMIRIGDVATITGLIRRADLNGSKCRLLSFLTDKSQWAVEICGSAEKVCIREDNLCSGWMLAALVQPREAELFQEMAQQLSAGGFTRFSETRDKHSGVLEVVRATLFEVLNTEAVELDICGSIQKGTQTHGSDVDIVIRTRERRVSRADKEAVAAKLRERPPFHRRHVHVGRSCGGRTALGRRAYMYGSKKNVACGAQP